MGEGPVWLRETKIGKDQHWLSQKKIYLLICPHTTEKPC